MKLEICLRNPHLSCVNVLQIVMAGTGISSKNFALKIFKKMKIACKFFCKGFIKSCLDLVLSSIADLFHSILISFMIKLPNKNITITATNQIHFSNAENLEMKSEQTVIHTALSYSTVHVRTTTSYSTVCKYKFVSNFGVFSAKELTCQIHSSFHEYLMILQTIVPP